MEGNLQGRIIGERYVDEGRVLVKEDRDRDTVGLESANIQEQGQQQRGRCRQSDRLTRG